MIKSSVRQLNTRISRFYSRISNLSNKEMTLYCHFIPSNKSDSFSTLSSILITPIASFFQRFHDSNITSTLESLQNIWITNKGKKNYNGLLKSNEIALRPVIKSLSLFLRSPRTTFPLSVRLGTNPSNESHVHVHQFAIQTLSICERASAHCASPPLQRS